jgi:hypothetical protein
VIILYVKVAVRPQLCLTADVSLENACTIGSFTSKILVLSRALHASHLMSICMLQIQFNAEDELVRLKLFLSIQWAVWLVLHMNIQIVGIDVVPVDGRKRTACQLCQPSTF